MMDITKKYQLPFRVDVVFSAWISSNTVISPATRMDIDPIVGGHYRLFIETDDHQSKNFGIFREIKTNALLRYSWEWNDDGEVSEITVKFSPTHSGCKVLLTHTGFEQPASRAMHDSGWDSYIEGLTKFLKNLH